MRRPFPIPAASVGGVLLVTLGGCGKVRALSGPSDASPPGSASAVPRTWPRDAPDPNAACSAHEECTVIMWDAFVPPDPCCEQRVGFMATTKAYAAWTRRYHDERCRGVSCKPLPAPGAEPACCASIGRCVNRKCIGGCEDPSLQVPRVSWLDPACQTRAPE